MEFNTCEEYVLAELEGAQEAVLTLNDDVERLEAENQLLRERLEAQPDPVHQVIYNEGRVRLFKSCTSLFRDLKDGDAFVPFKDWCLMCLLGYSLPKGISKTQFVEEFEPEFLEAYNERLAEESVD